MKIAILHPAFSLGGAGAVAVWILEALKKHYDLTLITTEDINFPELNAFFGTNLDATDVKTIKVRLLLGRRLDGFLAKIALTERYYQQHRDEFDLAIATRCEMDLGKPGIQYIHCPIWDDRMLRRVGQLPTGLLYRKTLLRWFYRQVAMRLGRYNENRMKQNLTLVNSNWMGKQVKETYGIEAQTVYPPVKDDFPDVPWVQREEGFVCIGGVSSGKHIEDIISIIGRVREAGAHVHLHIIGGCADPVYAKRMEQLRDENRDWLFWEGQLAREQLTRLVAKHRYGIHGMPNEHFGIAVAEMVKAGCIPFVPNSGGQVEIVNDTRLLYANISEAVDKILYILRHEAVQTELREHLRVQGQRFSAKTFIRDVKEVVDRTLGVERNVVD